MVKLSAPEIALTSSFHLHFNSESRDILNSNHFISLRIILHLYRWMKLIVCLYLWMPKEKPLKISVSIRLISIKSDCHIWSNSKSDLIQKCFISPEVVSTHVQKEKKRLRFDLKIREKYLQFQLWCVSVITRGIKMRVQQSIWFVGVCIWNRENGLFENQKCVIMPWWKCGWWWPQTPQ